nr:hypothetical protein [Tanacetum cinerariifolium]
MTTLVIDLTSRPDSPNVHPPLQATATETIMTTTTTTTTHPPPPPPQQSTTYFILIKCIGELEQIMENLIQDNKHLEERDFPEADMKEILNQRIWETNSYKAHEDNMMMYEALEKSMNRPSGTSGSLGAFGSSQLPSPPPPPSTSQSDQSKTTAALSSLKTAALAKYTAWTTTNTRLRPSVSLIPEDLHINDDMAPDEQVHLSDDEDIRNAHIPKASALASTYRPPPENSLLAQTDDMAMFMDWFCKRQGITKLKPQDLEGPAFKLVKVFHPNVTIQSDFFFNKDLDYLRYGSKGVRPGLSISKMKAAYYPDVGLEEMVPDQMWIEEECKYDIASIAVRTHMRILSIVIIEVLSMYGQRIEDFQLGIESYQTQLNLTKPRWDATAFEYKHDFMVIDSPRAVTFRDKYEVQMIMRFNEIHKFSDGTLHQIDEALDYRVKEFKVTLKVQ